MDDGHSKGVVMANARIFTQDDFKEWGRIGGGNARGKAKTRPAGHYERISALGVKAREEKRRLAAKRA